MKTYFGYVELFPLGFSTHKVVAENENKAWDMMLAWAQSRDDAMLSTLEMEVL